MSERQLIEAFNDCVNRLANGESIEECLRRHPQHAVALRPMLEAGLLVRRAQISPVEVVQSQDRVRARITQEVQGLRVRPRASYGRYVALAASLLLVFASVFGSAALGSANALPGDPLYGVKRGIEAITLALAGSDSLREEYNARRISEIKQLLALQRPADVEFRGNVELIDGTTWLVSGVALDVAPGTPGTAAARVGDTVRVRAQTTTAGTLIATAVELVNNQDDPPTPTPQPTEDSTPVPTIDTTETPTTPAPTRTPRPTRTAPPTPTRADGCNAAVPAGWQLYTIRAGDTLSEIALYGDVSLDELMEANCLTFQSVIRPGQPIYVPAILPTDSPRPAQASTPASGAQSPPNGSSNQINPPSDDNKPPSDDNGNDDSGNDDNGEDDDGREEDDDNSGSDDEEEDDDDKSGGEDEEEEDDDNSGSDDEEEDDDDNQ
jgi:hypothetical protein